MDLYLALIGDKKEGYPPHEKAEEALKAISKQLTITCFYRWIPTSHFLSLSREERLQYHGYWAGSGPYQNEEGALEAIRFARENNIPFIGTCSGFKYAVWEFVKNALDNSNYKEFIEAKENCSTEYKVINVSMAENTMAFRIYKRNSAKETTHCTFQIANDKTHILSQDWNNSGFGEDGTPVLIELCNADFHSAALFLPQCSFPEQNDSPLIEGWLNSVVVYANRLRFLDKNVPLLNL